MRRSAKSHSILRNKLRKIAGRHYNDKEFLKDPLMFSQLAPTIMESRNYKILGKLITPEYSRFEKISSFSKRDDTLSKLLKRSRTESVENMVMGTAITNLTKMDFPAVYGELELERLIMQPGGAFPLATVNLVVGVVTCSNRMSLIVEHAEERIGTDIVNKINKTVLEFLLQ